MVSYFLIVWYAKVVRFTLTNMQYSSFVNSGTQFHVYVNMLSLNLLSLPSSFWAPVGPTAEEGRGAIRKRFKTEDRWMTYFYPNEEAPFLHCHFLSFTPPAWTLSRMSQVPTLGWCQGTRYFLANISRNGSTLGSSGYARPWKVDVLYNNKNELFACDRRNKRMVVFQSTS